MSYERALQYTPQKTGINVNWINWDKENNEVYMEFYGSERHPDPREQVRPEDIEREIRLGETFGWFIVLIDDVNGLVTGENKTFWKERIITFLDHPAFATHDDRGRNIVDTATEVSDQVVTKKQLEELNLRMRGHHLSLGLHQETAQLSKDRASKTFTDKKSGQEMHLFKTGQIEI
jgi:hypothetical protein